MIMGQMGEATPRGPSRASIEKDLQMKADFAENMGILEANLQKARGSVKALYAKLEEGRANKKTLKDEELKKVADMAEEATLEAIVEAEQEEKEWAEKIEGRKRSLN